MNDVVVPPLSRPTDPSESVSPARPRRKRRWLSLITLVLLGLFVYTQMGLYSIQPIGAIPNGATVLVWRQGREPFFNSPDAMCLLIQDGVSLLCRGMAMAQAPANRIVLRLPYQDWAYLASTGGQTFHR